MTNIIVCINALFASSFESPECDDYIVTRFLKKFTKMYQPHIIKSTLKKEWSLYYADFVSHI